MTNTTIKNTIIEEKRSENEYNTKADAIVEECGFVTVMAQGFYECAKISRNKWVELEKQNNG